MLCALLALVSPAGAQHHEYEEQEPNNTPAQANWVTMQSSVIGSAVVGDVDYFALPTPEHLATYQIRVQIYTPHPPLPCEVTVAVRSEREPNQIIYSRSIDYEFSWSGLSPVYYVGIESTCDVLHYQIDFTRVRGPYTTYLPTIGGSE